MPNPQDNRCRCSARSSRCRKTCRPRRRSSRTRAVEATVGGGVVKATVTGSGELVAISIDPGVVDPDDVETLEDLVLAAVTEANRQARELATAEARRRDVRTRHERAGRRLGGLLG